MAIEDLDLEFEDENEVEKSDALDVEVDLSFSAYPAGEVLDNGANPAKSAPKKRPKPMPRANPQAKARPDSNVTDIKQAQTTAPRPRPQVKPTSQVQPQPDYANHEAGDIAELKAEIDALKGQIQKIQHQADIKVAVAQAEKEYLVEVVSNAKVLDHQVTQVLTRINKKVPQLGAEVQSIKKYVSEFVKKTAPQKKDKGG